MKSQEFLSWILSFLNYPHIMEKLREITVSAPGKIIFHGEHAVVYGKPAVAASLSLRSSLTVSATKDSNLLLQFAALNVNRTFSLQQLDYVLQGCNIEESILNEPSSATESVINALQQYIADETVKTDSKEILGIVAFLYLYYNLTHGLPGLSVTVNSEIPFGAGFGSSGAFCVTVAAALLEFSGHVSSDKKADNIAEWSPADKELINKWAYVGEQVIHGQASGVDNTVSCLGGGLSFTKNEKVPIVPLDRMPTLSIILVNTNVPRSTKDQVARFRQRYQQFQDVCEPILDSMAAIARRSVSLLQTLATSPADTDSISALGELIQINQQLLNAMGVGHQVLDKVVATAAKNGLQAKLTGAGGGGCAFVLIPQGTHADTLAALRKELEEQGFHVWDGVSVGGPGVQRHL